jgi:predicted nucleic acid-binding protein
VTTKGAVYLDASAASKLVRAERETQALADFMLDRESVYSSWALFAELVRATRRATDDDEAAVIEAHALLARTALVEIDRRILHAASRVEPLVLRSLDAIHLATVLELGEEIETMVVYDRQLAAGARRHGIQVVAPGADV